MKPVVLLPDGVGIRNFALGPFLSLLGREAPGLILHPIPEANLAQYAGAGNGHWQWQELRPYRESALAATLRYSLAYAQMFWGDSQSMRYGRRARLRGTRSRRLMLQGARCLGWCLASQRGIRFLDRRHCRHIARLPQVADYQRLFRHYGATVLFCSHQRPLEILPPVLAARSLGIPTACFIFSWDNLTSKGRIAAPFEHYLVWSHLMRQELLRYYPEVAPERTHIVGTPQFDPYADPALSWRRQEFFGPIGADPARPLICYSGGDTFTCPEDPLHVDILMSLVRSGQVRRRPQVLVRPAPVDDGSRYQAVREKYPEMIFAQPAWLHTQPGNWARCIPRAEDVRFLANLTHHANVNVNLASTMTLDFAIHDRPVVNVAFDVSNPPPCGRPPLWEFYYRFEHYRPVVELGAARFARSPRQLAEHINAYLDNPALDRERRRRFVELEVGVPIGESSSRVVEVLAAVSRRSRQGREEHSN
ncbi:MAG: hypothetical protein ABSH34_13790 [Verrucomicrobiota bacterium]|jgi:hypothetical protein